MLDSDADRRVGSGILYLHGRSGPVKKLLTIGVLVVAGMAVGCSSNKKPEASNAARDYAPQPAAPVHEATIPVTNVTPTPAGGGTVQNAGFETPRPADPTPMRGQEYVVKKGDTLWSIAAKKYNDGQQWKKIRAANPNIKGEQVLVGQKIILP
jgi:nucleoid-associated protein YgaU